MTSLQKKEKKKKFFTVTINGDELQLSQSIEFNSWPGISINKQ